MLLEILKQHMLLPEKEFFINKTFEIDGVSAILLSITSHCDKNILWVMYHQPAINLEEAEEEIENTTNRKDMIRNIYRNSAQDFNFYEIKIQGQKMTFSSSSASTVYDNNIDAYMQLQHFIEHGMNVGPLDKIDLSNIVIAAYEQSDNEELPQIDLSKNLDIIIKIDESYKEVLINQPLHLELGNMEKGKKFYFYDSINKVDRFFFVDSIEHYDIWQKAELHFSNEKMKGFSKEEIEKMKKQHLKGVEETCPKGMDLAIIKYEAEDNIQLNFYSKEFLEKKRIFKSSASFLFFASHGEMGINSLESQICMLKPIPKDFKGSMDIELFSWIMKIPEYSIEV